MPVGREASLTSHNTWTTVSDRITTQKLGKSPRHQRIGLEGREERWSSEFKMGESIEQKLSDTLV